MAKGANFVSTRLIPHGTYWLFHKRNIPITENLFKIRAILT